MVRNECETKIIRKLSQVRSEADKLSRKSELHNDVHRMWD